MVAVNAAEMVKTVSRHLGRIRLPLVVPPTRWAWTICSHSDIVLVQ